MRSYNSALQLILLLAAPAASADVLVGLAESDITKPDPTAKYWVTVPVAEITLMAQPMTTPRPAETTTSKITVQALHDGRWLALRLRWKDSEANEAGRLGEFSDAAAVEFPVGKADAPPPVFMGAKDHPVHIFHWRAQYQRDAERGKPTMHDLYPNMAVDIYPMEFEDRGALPVAAEAARDQFSPGRSQGNPQSYAKTGLDEILAEGFSTSSVQENHESSAKGVWADGEWTLVILRELRREGGSELAPGGRSFIGAAVWQGGRGEVGARKSVTMSWTPIVIQGGKS